jgi:hypothetical protein
MKELGSWMAKLHSHPSLVCLLLELLGGWRHRTRRLQVDERNNVRDLEQAQATNEWEVLINGHMPSYDGKRNISITYILGNETQVNVGLGF